MASPTHSILDVVGIGNALVDILCFVDNSFLDKHGLTKATMQLCTRHEQDNILADIADSYSTSGGSAANTIASLAGLGTHAGFMGTIADDHWGDIFQKSLETINVSSFLKIVADNQHATGTSVILVTPDSERTMNTHLGAAQNISISSLDTTTLQTAGLVYIEGYTFDRDEEKHAVKSACKMGQTSGNKVVLTLSDAFCVERHRNDFIELIKTIDILFCNEAEMCHLLGIENQIVTPEIILQHKNFYAPLTIITQSERGCTVIHDTEIFSVPARADVELVDLTGAGDQFAAGFLYGIIQSYSLLDCARFGIECASAVIAQLGPRLELDQLINLKTSFTRS